MSIQVSTPSQDEAVAMGIREWPQQVKKMGEWSDSSPANGSTLTRYILEGKGSVRVRSSSSEIPVRPGTLVRISNEDDDDITWTVTTPDMIILTPGYEEGGKLAAVVVVLVALLGAIVIGSGGAL